MIGIIGALAIEADTLKQNLENPQIKKISSIEFWFGELWGTRVVIAVSGVGKVNAAICAQTMILEFKPDLIINTGIAGGYAGAGLNVGDVITATGVVQHDFDTSPFDPPGTVTIPQVGGVTYFPCTAISVANVKPGIIATGDQFINSGARAKEVAEKFDAIAFEMEGGSIGQVCYINHIPFCAIRAISDNGDDNSHVDMEDFGPRAAENSIEILKNFLTTRRTTK